MTERTDSPTSSDSGESGLVGPGAAEPGRPVGPGAAEPGGSAGASVGGLVVAAAIVRLGRDGEVELFGARRSAPESLAGQWELPGGKVDRGEHPEAALHRELVEELGIRVQLLECVHGPTGDDWPIPGSARNLRIWVAGLRPDSPEPHALDDHDEVSWFTQSTVTNVPWLPADLSPATAILNSSHLRSLLGSRDPHHA